MNDPDCEAVPLTPRESANAPAVIAKTLGLGVVMLGLIGTMVEVGVWKGRTDEKVEHLSGQVEKFDPRLSAVEASTQSSKQDLDALREDVKQLRADMTKRADHQMDRLNAIADRVGAKPAR